MLRSWLLLLLLPREPLFKFHLLHNSSSCCSKGKGGANNWLCSDIADCKTAKSVVISFRLKFLWNSLKRRGFFCSFLIIGVSNSTENTFYCKKIYFFSFRNLWIARFAIHRLEGGLETILRKRNSEILLFYSNLISQLRCIFIRSVPASILTTRIYLNWFEHWFDKIIGLSRSRWRLFLTFLKKLMLWKKLGAATKSWQFKIY